MLNTNSAKLILHSSMCCMVDVTYFTRDVIFNKSCFITKFLTRKKSLSRFTSSIATAKFYLILDIGTLFDTITKDSVLIKLVHITYNVFTIIEIFLLEVKPERCATNTNITAALSNFYTILINSKSQRHIASRRTDNLPIELPVIRELLSRELC